MMRAPKGIAGIAVTVAAVAACAPAAGLRGAPLPPPPAEVTVAMDEYRFRYDRDLPAGRVVFRFVNEGDEPHRVSFIALPEDIPPIDEQLRGSKRRAIAPLAAVGNLAPGADESFAVDLAPGVRYGLICFVETPQGRSHALLGMSSEFRSRSGGT